MEFKDNLKQYFNQCISCQVSYLFNYFKQPNSDLILCSRIEECFLVVHSNLFHSCAIWYSIPTFIAWIFLRELDLVVSIVLRYVVLAYISKEQLVFYRVVQDGIESYHNSSSFLIKKLIILSAFAYHSGHSRIFSIASSIFFLSLALRAVSTLRR